MTKPTYPAARRLDLVEKLPVAAPTYDVPDPYRWLEDPATAQSLSWLEAEDTLASDHLSALAGRTELRTRLTSLMAAGVVTAPAWRGERQFFMRRTAEQEHAVLVTVDPGGRERTLLDPDAARPLGHHNPRCVAAIEGGRTACLPNLRRRRRGVDPAGD